MNTRQNEKYFRMKVSHFEPIIYYEWKFGSENNFSAALGYIFEKYNAKITRVSVA